MKTKDSEVASAATDRWPDHPSLKLLLIVAVLAFAAAGWAGCGGDDDSGDSADADAGVSQPTTIDVTSLPILDNAPYFWAIDTGLFEQNNLTIKDHTSTGGAADIPGLLQGDFQFVFSNTVSALLSREKGLPVQMVTGGSVSIPEPDKDSGATVVAPDSDIKTAADLEGKTIAVNTLNNIDHLYTQAWLEAEGVDPSSVEFLEIPFPDQPVALLRERVDAVRTVTPFLEDLVQQGATVIGYPFQVQPDVFIAGFMTSDEYAQDNPEVVATFQDVLEQATNEVEDPANEDRLLGILEKRTGLSNAILKTATSPAFNTTPDTDSLQQTAELMDEHGLVEIADPATLVDELVPQQE